jgi:integral membrane protein
MGRLNVPGRLRKVAIVLRDAVRSFRWIAVAEGLSFLLLLGVAMPLKYMAGMPLMVRIVGSIHGGLFVLYVLAAFRAAHADKWSFRQLLIALIASVLPFGPFVIDRKLKEEAAERNPHEAVPTPGSAE